MNRGKKVFSHLLKHWAMPLAKKCAPSCDMDRNPESMIPGLRTVGIVVNVAAFAVPAICVAADEPRRPNIVIILAMVGKWHMGKNPAQIPAARGFERDFSLLDGAGSYWDMTNFTAASPKTVFTEDGKYLTKLPPDYYATKTYTDKLIGFIDANRGDGKPFFAYVSHQAPHDHTLAGP